MQAGSLLPRDIHQPPAPPWWPPAPGWWLLGALLLVIVATVAWFVMRRRRRRREAEKLFDATLAQVPTPAAGVAAMSQLLRRASRRRDAAADKLQGDDWIAFLDRDAKTPAFTGELGRALCDAGFRRDVDASIVDALRPLARARFVQWMAARR